MTKYERSSPGAPSDGSELVIPNCFLRQRGRHVERLMGIRVAEMPVRLHLVVDVESQDVVVVPDDRRTIGPKVRVEQPCSRAGVEREFW